MVQMGANTTYIEAEFGGPVSEDDGTKDLTTTAARIVDNDPEGVSLIMINVGANDAYVFTDDTVSSTKGILLLANGGFVSFTVRDDQVLPALPWWGVSSTGTTTVLYIRLRRYTYPQLEPIP